jgi:hypothetical protein
MKRVSWVGIGLVTLAAWTGSPAWGVDNDPLEKSAASVNASAASAGSQQVAARLASELNASCKCSAYTAAKLTTQRTQNDWGWGEVLIANELAQALSLKLGISLTKATAMVTQDRQQDMGWGQIAHANGLNLGRLVSGVERSANAVGAANKTAQGNAGNSSSGGTSSGGPGASHSSGSAGGGGQGGGSQGKGAEGHSGGNGGGAGGGKGH